MAPNDLTDEIRYRLLNHLSAHPDASQRDVARELGISVGKVNYCLRALVRKGLLKVTNFRNSRNKSAYLYILTRRGIEEKITVTYQFLRAKIDEYDGLAKEIERLKGEVLQHERQSNSNR